jgi:deoxyadenosine/deoxycytidine kinase
MYLFIDVAATLKNIKMRGRSYEQNIKVEYLESVQHGYFEYFKQLTEQRILIIDLTGVDFVKDEKAYKGIVNALNSPYDAGINRLAFSEEGVFKRGATTAMPKGR